MIDSLVAEVPDPQELGPAVIAGVEVPALGWRHEGRLYLFTTQPGPTNRYHAVVVRPPTPQLGVNFPTREEAEQKARRLYWEEAMGSKAETFERLSATTTRLNYWLVRKEALGGGELYGQIRRLMNEILPLGDLEPYRLRAEPPRPGQPFAVQIQVGEDYEHAISGMDPTPNVAVARFLLEFEQWASSRRRG